MQKRTWPYGTKKRGRVLLSEPSRTRAGVGVLLLVDEDNEGHILITKKEGQGFPPVGSEGILTFTEGGPTGGYWKFEPTTLESE